MALNINGTTGISGVDGSASAPALQGTDSNTGVSFGADILAFNVAGSEKARVHSNGNFGIGAPNPGQKLVVQGSGTTIATIGNTDDGTAQLTLSNVGSSNANFQQNSGDFLMKISSNDRLKIFDGGGMDAFRQSNGNVFQYRRVTTSLFVIDNLSNESNTRMRIRNPAGTINYNSSSDYRLKENDVKITDGITRLKKLRPITFKWKSGTNTYDGFFAHEVSEACPTAVDGTKDQVATADDVTKGHATNVGDPIYQGIDHGKMVPLLTAALQEAIAKIEVLETKVAALEAG